MRRVLAVVITLLVAAVVVPADVLAQTAASRPFRPYLHVFIAFGVAWVMVAVWVVQIGRKVKRISERLEAEGKAR
jgi:uncharacterized membrane protein